MKRWTRYHTALANAKRVLALKEERLATLTDKAQGRLPLL